MRDDETTYGLTVLPSTMSDEGRPSFIRIGQTFTVRALAGCRANAPNLRSAGVRSELLRLDTMLWCGEAPRPSRSPTMSEKEETSALAAPVSWGRGSTCDPWEETV
jgi:hypothetical protein